MWREVDSDDLLSMQRHCELLRKQFPEAYHAALCTAGSLASQVAAKHLRAFVYESEVDYIGFGIDYSASQQSYCVTGLACDVDDPSIASELFLSKLLDVVPIGQRILLTRPVTHPPIEAFSLLDWLEDAVCVHNRFVRGNHVDLFFQATSEEERWEIRT